MQRRGCKVTVVSTIRTQPAMIADELRRQADGFVDLMDMAEHITRRQMEPRGRPAPGAPQPRSQAAPPTVPPRTPTPADPFQGAPELPE